MGGRRTCDSEPLRHPGSRLRHTTAAAGLRAVHSAARGGLALSWVVCSALSALCVAFFLRRCRVVARGAVRGRGVCFPTGPQRRTHISVSRTETWGISSLTPVCAGLALAPGDHILRFHRCVWCSPGLGFLAGFQGAGAGPKCRPADVPMRPRMKTPVAILLYGILARRG
jgi:hypothetical protein